MNNIYNNVLHRCGYEVVEEKGIHDIRAILYSSITKHIKEYPDNFDDYASFVEIDTSECMLKDLLNNDLNEVLSHNHNLCKIIPKIEFEEVSGNKPIAHIFISKVSNASVLITFDKYFLPMINRAAAITEIMTLSRRTEGVVFEKECEIVMGQEYDDEQLYTNYILTVDAFYRNDEILLSEFKYIFSPFDLCEIIIGIRRYVIFHEIGHAIHSGKELHEIYDVECAGLEEFVCDHFAVNAIMNCYSSNDKGAKLFEFRNVIKGIQIYLILLAKIESYHSIHHSSREHPYAYLRLLDIFIEIINHKRFDKDIQLQYELVKEHFRLKKFYLFCLLESPKGFKWSSKLSSIEQVEKFYKNHKYNFSEIFSSAEAYKIYSNYFEGVFELIAKFDLLKIGETDSFKSFLIEEVKYGSGGK